MLIEKYSLGMISAGLLASVSSVCAQGGVDAMDINNKEASDKPWIVKIKGNTDDGILCSGVAVSPTMVISTTGGRVDSGDEPIHLIDCSSSKVEYPDGSVRKVAFIRQISMDTEHIRVLYLSNPHSLSSYLEYELAPGSYIKRRGDIYGYGQFDAESVLQHRVKVKVDPDSKPGDIQSMMQFDTKEEVCKSNNQSSDLGGPLIVNGKIVGLTTSCDSAVKLASYKNFSGLSSLFPATKIEVGKTYTIQSPVSAKFFDVSGSSQAEDFLWQNDYKPEGKSQQWQIKLYSENSSQNEFVSIMNMATSRCIVANDSAGKPLALGNCEGDEAKWKITSSPNSNKTKLSSDFTSISVSPEKPLAAGSLVQAIDCKNIEINPPVDIPGETPGNISPALCKPENQLFYFIPVLNNPKKPEDIGS